MIGNGQTNPLPLYRSNKSMRGCTYAPRGKRVYLRQTRSAESHGMVCGEIAGHTVATCEGSSFRIRSQISIAANEQRVSFSMMTAVERFSNRARFAPASFMCTVRALMTRFTRIVFESGYAFGSRKCSSNMVTCFCNRLLKLRWSTQKSSLPRSSDRYCGLDR